MSGRRSILVFEYLLADRAAWLDARSSMRREAAAMLTAIVQDLNRLDDVQTTVLLSSEAAQTLSADGGLGRSTEIVVCDNSPSIWLANPSQEPSSFDATLVIAPECGQILVSLLKQLQSGSWQKTMNLNVRWPMAEIFTDKYRTFQWLQEHGIATPPTKTLSDDECDKLSSSRMFRPQDYGSVDDSLPTSPKLAVIKPRDGVGCDRIQLIPGRQQWFEQQAQTRFADDRWILQKFLPGVPCSVGLIGRGSVLPPIILPPAQQDIRLSDQHPCYHGGQIPCSPEILPAVAAVAEQLASALGSFSGYIGADVVVTRDPQGTPTASVIEINPRLCTSYVGYRVLAKDNLAAAMLQRFFDDAVKWNAGAVAFYAAGNVERVDDRR